MRLIDWQLLLDAMSVPGTNPQMTYVEAKQRGFEDREAWVASVFMNYEGQALLYTLRAMARDPTFEPFLRVLMCMRLSELCSIPDARSTWRAEALSLAKSLIPSLERAHLLAWIESARFYHGDLKRVPWQRLREDLERLLNNRHPKAVGYSLHYVERQLKRRKIDDADSLLRNVIHRMGRKDAPFVKEDVTTATRLTQEIKNTRRGH